MLLVPTCLAEASVPFTRSLKSAPMAPFTRTLAWANGRTSWLWKSTNPSSLLSALNSVAEDDAGAASAGFALAAAALVTAGVELGASPCEGRSGGAGGDPPKPLAG